jgi:hypothetical protein
MRTRVRKHKLGSTKPASQLFLFSNKLNKNIDIYFSGNVVIEIGLSGYDYKYHAEAKQVVDFMNIYCKERAIKPYKYLTVVLNYKPIGLTLATLSGEYDYPIAIHGTVGYKQVAILHTALEALRKRLKSFEEYSSITMSYAHIANCEPIKLSKRSFTAFENQLKKSEQSILKSISSVIGIFHKKFQPQYRR